MALTVSSSVFRSAATPPPDANAAGTALLAALHAGDTRPLEALYQQQRDVFLTRMTFRFPRLSADDRLDVCHDAFMVFAENVVSGQLTALTAAPSTYLFAICLRRCQELEKKLGKKFNLLPLEVIEEKQEAEEDDFAAASLLLPALSDDPFSLDHELDDDGLARQQAFTGAWKHLSTACRELLDGFYYKGWNLQQLTDTLDYEDAASTKTRKSQCLARLRTQTQGLLPRHLR